MLKKLRQRFSGSSSSSPVRKNNSLVRQARRLRHETLEPRHLLTGGLTLQPLSSATLQAGAPLQIPINATDTGNNPVTYTVTSSNPAITASLPTGNPYLELNVSHTSSGAAGDTSFTGTMIIELFPNFAPNTVSQIITLVNEGFYNGVVFNRVASDGGSPFVIQAGEPTAADSGITVPTIDNELNENLRYTGTGTVGMARTSADDTNNSQFFITAGPESFLDFQYTIFGQLVSGDNVRAEINAVPQDNSNGSGDGTPLSPVTITSASIINDPYDLALQVSAPLGTTGSSTITVSADDGHGGTDSQSFLVTISGDSSDPGPFLETITPPTTATNTPITFQLPFFDLDPTDNPPTFTNDTASNPNFNVSVDPNTGMMTVTPLNGFVGVGSLSVEVSSAVSQAPSTRTFPIFVTPAAPTDVTLLSSSDTGSSNSDDITSLNNSSGHTLQFQVDGVTAGDTVLLFDGSTQIGSAVASSTSVIVTTDGSTVLADGSHQITAEQVLPGQSYSVGNYNGTIDLTSPQTTALNVTVDAAGPTFTTAPVTAAQTGQPYVYTVQASDSVPSGLTYSVVSGPAGFSVDPNTGVVTWTPTAGQVGTQAVDLRATDVAGNMADQTFDVAVSVGPPVTVVSTTVSANSAFGAGGMIPITVTFTAPVTVTGTPQLTLNDGAIVNYSSGSGTATLTFTYTVATGENTQKLDYASTTALSANGGTIQDASLNDAVLTLPATGTDGLASHNIVIDTVAPSATVNPLTTNDSTPTITGTVSDPSPSGGIASVTIVVDGQTVPATVTGGTWSATVPTPLADNTYDVQVTAVDNAGNQFTTTANNVLTIDTVAPFVTAVSTTAAAGSTFTLGQTVSITISFDENVNVTGTPHLGLNNGGVANFSSGSGTSTLTFVYTVAAGQSTSDLDYASTTALTLNGGTINDTAGNAALLTLPATGTDGLATQDIIINSPAITSDVSITKSTTSATTIIGGSVSYTIVVTNNGPNAATGVTMTDVLPATLSFGTQVQASGTAFTLGHTGNTVTDTIASLASGASATFTVVAEVNQNVAANVVISNTATVSSTNPDSNTANNTATANTTTVLSGVVLTTDPFDATKTELMVGGTTGNDNISFVAAAGGKVTVNMNGKAFGPFAVTGRIVAMGQAGNDVITVAPGITIQAYLYSGTGNDSLTGGGGSNVLVGGGGTDVLVGGPGRNVLIAGAGASKLYAAKLGTVVGSNSGSILIGGTTSFDQNDTALNAIMQEWGSSDAYATRVTKIRAGTNTSGFALTASTIHQPAAKIVDQLYASTGGYDWFMGLTAQELGIDPHKKSLLAFN